MRREAGRHVRAAAALLFLPAALFAADLETARSSFRTGAYDECIRAAAAGIEDRPWEESWHQLKIRGELARGRYADALVTMEAALERFSASIQLRILGFTVYRMNGRPQDAERMLDEIEGLIKRYNWRYSGPDDRIALGRFFLLKGADPRQVLEVVYDRIKQVRPDHVETYLATGDLALEKHDYAVAAEAFRRAVKLAPGEPAAHLGLARSLAGSDAEGAQQALFRALEINPQHAGSLIMAADKLIDAEDYDGAGAILDRVLDVNPGHPEACAYRAVLAHLAGDAGAERSWRIRALTAWSANPLVDHVIGRELSQKYRFAEGAAYQRQALRFDSDYRPAITQLGQDLLRLGEEEGWRLINRVYQEDGYNVVAHNLVTLAQTMGTFTTLQADGFTLRMEPREAAIYGRRALQILAQARRCLCAKYDAALDRSIVVEIFPEQKDFAVRTFGLPGGEGFLGVCFGNVITANSPASQGEYPSNWEAVLWHEFCHVVTLLKTRNKMPRWLSEGISVYEEKQANPAWGQSMNARYRRMILDGGLVPVSRLSGAFLNPPSPLHLQFAYYESSLVIEYLVETYGLPVVTGILADLSTGRPIETALKRHVGSLDALDEAFAAYAVKRAQELAPEADWESPELSPETELSELQEWCRQHPKNIEGLTLLAMRLLEARRWREAKQPLEELVRLYPENVGAGNPYLMLATVHRELGDSDAERAVLERLAARSADARAAYLRLIELCEGAGDWEGAARNAERLLAVNPLLRAPYRSLAHAAEALDEPDRAIRANRALLCLDPRDPAGTHFRLARLLKESGDLDGAYRHVLMALAEAPRFRAAHRMLLEIAGRRATPSDSEPEG